MKMRSFYKKIPFFIYKKLPIVIYKKLNAPNSNLKKIQFLGRIYTPAWHLVTFRADQPREYRSKAEISNFFKTIIKQYRVSNPQYRASSILKNCDLVFLRQKRCI